MTRARLSCVHACRRRTALMRWCCSRQAKGVRGVRCVVAARVWRAQVSYVLDTEDVMVRLARHRPGGKEARERARDARVVRFAKWLGDKHEAAEKRRQEEEEAAKALTGGAS